MNWYVKEESETVGPMKWRDLEFKVRSGEISKNGSIKNDMDNQWVSISEYFSQMDSKGNDELGGLIPKGTDVIFLLALFTFFIGVGLYFVNNFLGYGTLIVSLVFEYGSIYFSHKNDARSITKNVGNIIALVWAILQTLITICFIIFTLL